MSTLKKCDFCFSIQQKGEAYIQTTVNIGGDDFGSRSFDMCPTCQAERNIEIYKTTEVHAMSLLEEVIREIVSDQINSQGAGI